MYISTVQLASVGLAHAHPNYFLHDYFDFELQT